jgi:hypothetical protein
MDDKEVQQRFLGTACETAMFNTVTCYENNVLLNNCDSVFDSLSDCMRQNNLIKLIDPEFNLDTAEVYGNPQKPATVSAPGARNTVSL